MKSGDGWLGWVEPVPLTKRFQTWYTIKNWRLEHNDGGLVQIILLFNWVMFRFHVNLQGCNPLDMGVTSHTSSISEVNLASLGLEVIGHKKNLPQRPNLRTLSKDVGESEGRTWYVIMWWDLDIQNQILFLALSYHGPILGVQQHRRGSERHIKNRLVRCQKSATRQHLKGEIWISNGRPLGIVGTQ